MGTNHPCDHAPVSWDVEIVLLPHPDAARRISRAYALILKFARTIDEEGVASNEENLDQAMPRDTLDD